MRIYVFRGMVEMGRRRVNLFIDDETYMKLWEKAKEMPPPLHGRFSQIVNEALKQYLNIKGKKNTHVGR